MATVAKRTRRPRGTYTITKKRVGGPFPYDTYTLRGTTVLGGRIREQHNDRAVLEGRKQQLEVTDANAPDERTVVSHLTSEQVREAEAAFQRLNGKSLALAVDHFVSTYREPTTDKLVGEVVDDYLAEKIDLRSTTLSGLRIRLKKGFAVDFEKKKPHEITTADVLAYLKSRSAQAGKNAGEGKPAAIMPKTWNNIRGDLNALFEWCRRAPRKWTHLNPVHDIQKRTVTGATPHVLDVRQCMELMRCAAAYKNGRLVPYFALTLFAGIRPSVKDGEIVKLANHPDLQRLFKLDRGVITIPPAVAKGRGIRQIKVRPNLMAWLERYPIDKFPICPDGFAGQVGEVRAMMKLLPDVLRHTFISMHVAKFKSVGEAALEAGNSESMVKRHYLNVVIEAEAELFWMITPDTVLPVIGGRGTEKMTAIQTLFEKTSNKVYVLKEQSVDGQVPLEQVMKELRELQKFNPDPDCGSAGMIVQSMRLG